jgi:two-component system, OmpR family, response regulator MprA
VPSILIVDDEPGVRESLSRALGLERFSVTEAEDGARALELIAKRGWDAIVLDVSMPEPDGLEVCRRLRAIGDSTPILMLTARDAVDDRVAGLDAGADDYLVKPFALKELLARLRALLRRVEPRDEAVLKFEDLVLDLGAHEASRGGEAIELTRTEFLLLELFMRNPRQVLSRSQIYEEVWDYDFGAASNSLGVYVGYLRRKTEAGGRSRLINTAHGVGYILKEPK